MPLFEYRCKQCEHVEEVLQKHGEPPPAECPECGATHTLEKAISLPSFQLKGGGWYKDLYSSTPKDQKKSDGGSKGDGGSKSDGGKSSKSDTKAA